MKWDQMGELLLAEVEEVTHNVKTCRFKPSGGGEIPFSYLPGQLMTLHIVPQGISARRSKP